MSAFVTEPLDDLVSDLAGYDEQTLRDLIERAYQLRELTEHPGWALLVDLVTAQTVARQKMILSGACKTLEDYARQTGWIKGAQDALRGPMLIQERLDTHRQQHEEEHDTLSPNETEQ